jgi:ribosomal protein L22
MERSEILDWLVRHTEQIQDNPEQLVSRCDMEVRKHAEQDAWLHARDIAEEHNRHARHFWGAHASERYVAHEVCRVLANELETSEPIPADGHESDFVDDDVLGVLDPEARSRLLDYVHDLARGEEHRAWQEILRFTRKRGRALAREEHLSADRSFDGTHVYSETAVRIMSALARDFQRNARAVQHRL